MNGDGVSEHQIAQIGGILRAQTNIGGGRSGIVFLVAGVKL